MQQIWIPRTGGPDVLELRHVPEPQCQAHEVRIRVAAAGINFADILARVGLYPDAPPLPAVVGYEVSGTIDEVGMAVTGWKVGDQVLALTRFGGYSEYVCLAAAQIARVPDNLDLIHAAAIPVNYLTAALMLWELAPVQATHSVFIHSIAGGVGQAALQLCLQAGATVFGSASPSKHKKLIQLGVHGVIDSRASQLKRKMLALNENRGFDLILDANGASSLRQSYRCLAPLGRLFCYGVASLNPGLQRNWLHALRGLAQTPWFHPISLMNHNRGVIGVNLGHLWDKQTQLQKLLERLLAQFEAQHFQPSVDRCFRFDEAAEAQRYIQERKNFGKVLLCPA